MKNTKKKNGAAAKGKGRATLSAQQTIPYLSMHPDGVCKLPGGLYTKTVEYEDINYSVASTEDQTAIFSGWSSFLNYFDSSLPFQLSFINRRSRSRSKYKVNIPPAQDVLMALIDIALEAMALHKLPRLAGDDIHKRCHPAMVFQCFVGLHMGIGDVARSDDGDADHMHALL